MNPFSDCDNCSSNKPCSKPAGISCAKLARLVPFILAVFANSVLNVPLEPTPEITATVGPAFVEIVQQLACEANCTAPGPIPLAADSDTSSSAPETPTRQTIAITGITTRFRRSVAQSARPTATTAVCFSPALQNPDHPLDEVRDFDEE